MKPRNSDGTLRRADRSKTLTTRTVVARWVEAETLHLKQLGMSYVRIAEHVVRFAQGCEKAIVDLPEGIHFPARYRISPQAVHRAFQRGIGRLPRIEAETYRQLDNARSEEMLLHLQPSMRKGDPRAIGTGVRILDHQATINGYATARKHELASEGRLDQPPPIVIARQILDALDE